MAREPMTREQLDLLDAVLLADLKQQVADGLITQDEADDLARRIRGTAAGDGDVA
jgi:Trp operon repressor